jgi:endonuclease/exonuclease/phosphatase (EEP) superfamily protein YafD
VRRVAVALHYLVLAGLCLGVVFSVLARRGWYFELFTSFTIVYFAAAAVVFLSLALLRDRRGAAVALALALFHGWMMAPYLSFGTAAGAAQDGAVRVMLANVLTVNRDFEAFTAEVRKQDPDILCVQEVDTAWQRVLEGLHETYPHQHFDARSDNFGIALLSRLPLSEVEIFELGGVTVPAISAKVATGAGELRLLTLHTLPPIMKYLAASRNRQMAEAAKIAQAGTGPFALVGDLNVTPWSPHFQDLLRDGGLKEGRLGQGVMPTWPVDGWLPALVPIDHILVSPGITVTQMVRGGHTGSDHLPVVADLRFSGSGV